MAVHGGDGDRIAEAEGIELIYGGVLRTGGVGLVHGEHNWLAGAQEHIGNVLIRGGDAGADIGDEDDNGGGVYGDLRLLAHIEQYFAVGGRLDAAGIDHIELAAAPLTFGIEPVARDAGGVLNDAEPAPDKAVEEHRLADIRPAYYCNKRS